MPAKGWRYDPVERLLSKTRLSDDCWLWTGATTGRTGYGATRLDGVRMTAHRAVWILFNGPVPEGAELDHLCRVRLCVNPEHLEPVTHRVNCKRGHPLEGDNLVPWQWREKGVRQCRICNDEAKRAFRRRQRESRSVEAG